MRFRHCRPSDPENPARSRIGLDPVETLAYFAMVFLHGERIRAWVRMRVKKFLDKSERFDLSSRLMATKLKQARLKRGLTQAAVARLAYISERTYNSHERGRGGLCRDYVRAWIASALKVSVEQVFDHEGRAR